MPLREMKDIDLSISDPFVIVSSFVNFFSLNREEGTLVLERHGQHGQTDEVFHLVISTGDRFPFVKRIPS